MRISQKKRGWISESVWVVSGVVINVLVLLVGTKLLTSFMSVPEYGRFALGMSLVGMVVQVYATPVSQVAMRFFHIWKNQSKLHVFLGYFAEYLQVLVVILVVCFSFYFLTEQLFSGMGMVEFAILLCVFAFLMSVNRMAISIYDTLRERKLRAMTQALFESGRFFLAVSLILWLESPSAETVLVGFVLMGSAIMFFHIIYIRRKWPEMRFFLSNDRMASDRDMLFKSSVFPLMISNVSIWIVIMVDRWLIQGFCGLEEVGGYTAIYQLSFAPMLLVSSFLLILATPIIYQVIGEDIRAMREVVRINRYLSLIVFVFSVVIALIFHYKHDIIATILLGQDFQVYSWIFPWLILAGGCFASAQQLLLKLTCELSFFSLARFWGGIAIMAVIVYSLGLYWAELEGLVFAMVLVSIVMLIVALLLSFNVEVDLEHAE